MFPCEFKAQEVITSIRHQDEHKREELRQLFDEVLSSVRDIDPQVVHHLITEGALDAGLEADFTVHVQNLLDSECPILVAGRKCLVTAFAKHSLYVG